jgi:hypothetical protein
MQSIAVTLLAGDMPIIWADDSTEQTIDAQLNNDGDMYTGRGYINLPDGVTREMITGVVVSVVDGIDRRTADITVDTFGSPTLVNAPAACDPRGVFDQCENAQETCYVLDGEVVDDAQDNAPVCQVATQPVLNQADYIFGQIEGDEAFVLRFEAEDAEMDIVGVGIELLDDAGNRLIEGDAVEFISLADQAFNGMTLSYEGAFILGDTINQSQIGSMRISVIDSAGLISASLIANAGMQSIVEAGGACSTQDFSTICAEGLLCLGDGEDTACTAVASDCGDFPVTQLTADADNADRSTFTGTSEGAANLNPACDLDEAERLAQTDAAQYSDYVNANCTLGSCGGGGPNAALSLTADTEGSYTCTAEAVDGDPILYARSYCLLNDPIAELDCNDDIDNSNQNSAVTLFLAEGETAYLIVDGYGGAFSGDFTITCLRSAP